MTQDFSKKLTIIVNKELPSWQVLNAVAHISAYFGNQMGDSFGTGAYFTASDGAQYPRNSQYAIVVLAAKGPQLQAFAAEVSRQTEVATMSFIREMIETTDDDEIIAQVGAKKAEDIEVLGIGLFGEIDRLRTMTKQFRLWS